MSEQRLLLQIDRSSAKKKGGIWKGKVVCQQEERGGVKQSASYKIALHFHVFLACSAVSLWSQSVPLLKEGPLPGCPVCSFLLPCCPGSCRDCPNDIHCLRLHAKPRADLSRSQPSPCCWLGGPPALPEQLLYIRSRWSFARDSPLLNPANARRLAALNERRRAARHNA